MWDAARPLIMGDSQHIRSRIVGVNIPPGERVATAVVGGALVAFGLSRRSLRGLVLASVGAAAMVRAAAGRSALYRLRSIRRGIHVRRVITIQCTPREVYELWRDLTNLPRFMRYIDSVTIEEPGVSRWVIKEGKRELVSRVRIVEDTPGRRLRWQSLPGGDLMHEGELDLRPAPADRGTEVEVKLHYLPPGGRLVASALYGFLRKLATVQIGIELARLRQLIETGEIATGTRRLEDIRDLDILDGPALRPGATSPLTTAQTSVWPTVDTTGGAR